MATANGICSKALASGSIVLMARIVDGAAAAIRPSDVTALEYSAYEVDPFWPEQLTVLRGHHAVALAARDVLFDSPQVGSGWGVDDVGYNFRHEIKFAGDEPLQRARERIEVAYQLTFVSGRRTSVRFILQCSVLETPSPALPARGGSMNAHRASSIRRQP